MKNLLPPALLLLVCLVVLPGCPSSTTTKKTDTEAKTTPKNDPRRVGLELVRQAPDAARYWEGLQLLNTDIQQNATVRDRLELRSEARAFLQADAGLSDDELQEVESPTYRRADAHYLAECFLLHDAVRSLEINGVGPEELASEVLAWVDRHVLLHEQGDDWLPPAQVLERGYGSLGDRARVFLAMLRQIPMEGCAIVVPAAPDEIVLIGAFASASRDKLYLFDPRDGSAIRTPAGKVATLKDVQQDPRLLAGAGIDAKQLAAAQVKLACPLNALPARMEHLERALQVTDRVVLYLDAPAVKRDLARLTGLPVHVWNAAANGSGIANSPTRALRLFLPPDEGGIDKGDRRKRFQKHLVPWVAVLHGLDQLNLGRDQIPDVARGTLLKLIEELFKKFNLQPREMLLHGKGEDAIRRIGRAQTLFDDENLDSLAASDATFMRAVAAWREKLGMAYQRLVNGEPDGQAAVNAFWAEDQFLFLLLNTEGEDRLNTQARGDDRLPPPKKTLTTAIIAYAARDPLKQQAQWLRAMVWLDRAEREQARAERAGARAKALPRHKQLHDTWNNTRVAWNQIAGRAAVSPTVRQRRLDAIRQLLKRRDTHSAVQAAQMLAALHLELHQHHAANIHYACAVQHVQGAKEALPILRAVDADVAALLAKDPSGQVGLQGDVEAAVARLRAVQPALVHSIELLAGDWAPKGNYYWIRQRIARQIARWEKS